MCGAAACGGVQRSTTEATCSERRRRQRAANDGGDDAQRTTAETTHSERRRGGSGDGGSVRRRWRRTEGVRWRREVEAASAPATRAILTFLFVISLREITNTPWCVSSVAVVIKFNHVTNAVVATFIARMCVLTVMAA